MNRTRTSLLMLLVLAGLGIGFWIAISWNRSPDVIADSRFEKSARAASFLENVQYSKAEAIYQELQALKPKESAYVRNAAIAALANVKYQMDLSQDPKNNVDEIRAKLPELFERAADAIRRYRDTNPEDPIATQLDVLRDIRWISILSAANTIIADEEQSKLFDKLQGYVKQFPGNAFLVTQFNNAAEVMSAVEPKVLAQTVEPLRNVQRANPRNIYLLCLLVQRLVQLKDPSALELVEPLADLLQPFEWKWKMERRPKDLNDLRRAVEVGKTDLDAAFGILIGWVGEAKNTEGSLVDAKSIDVSELAFIDLKDIETMLQQRFEAGKKNPKRLPFEAPSKIAIDLSPCSGVRFFDWNVDTRPEILAWSDTQLQLGSIEGANAWKPLASLDLPSPILGVAAVDWFASDAHRGAKARTEAQSDDPAMQAILSVRHETIRDLTLYGNSGIQIVSFQAPVNELPQWSLLTDDVGLSSLKNVKQVTPIDWESDGDLDLVAIADEKVSLHENMGNRMFREVNSISQLPDPSLVIHAVAIVDYDRDVDLDIMVSHSKGFGVLENIQHGQFRFKELGGSWEPLRSANSLSVGDFNNNYSWDFAVGSHNGVHVVSTFTQPGQSTSAPLRTTLHSDNSVVALGDWNNDAKLDVISNSKNGVELWLNDGTFPFAKHSLAPAPSQQPPDDQTPNGISIADMNADGWLDAAVVIDGKPMILSATPQKDHQYLEYRVKGISDANGGGRNNQYAVGSTVEIFGPFGYQVRIIEEDSVHFGLGPDSAYSLRTIFVNGLTQGIIDPKSGSILEEKQVLIGSCPFAYGWDGSKWELITDLLWNAPLGLQIAKGKVLPDRRWEYLLVDGKLMQPYDHAYELRITEELWESAYFDHVALLQVDHPADIEVVSNEKVGPPSIAQPSLWIYSETFPPKSVIDHHGQNWLGSVLEQDGKVAIPFRKRFKQGLVEPSTLEIDFGSIDTKQSAQLILTGWIYPTDTSLNIGIDQNPNLDPPSPPQLWTVGPSGDFELASPFIGFPGGKPKSIVIPLDGLFKTDDHRIRITHSSEIYWDRIRLGYGKTFALPAPNAQLRIDPSSQTLEMQWLPLQSGILHYRGFSRDLPRDRHQPHWYDYQAVTTEPAWPPLGGRFTKYGDVEALIQRDDDRLVVMGSGDEMVLRFQIPEAPLQSGWVRHFILHSVGWDKDAALNTLEGQSSLPIPFSSMQQYPPGIEDRERASQIESMHRDSLTRKQPIDRFWKPTLGDSSNSATVRQ
ncbi:MAG: VCBS repeat-containing protein [Planctomycetes bacterium]|nr:VCBS repeat-containing protein [Planctomycetota bacterium]